MRGAIRLKESYRAWLIWGTPEAVDNYCVKHRAALAEGKEKTQMWEEFGEAIEEDFWLTPKRLWQTIW